MVPAKVVAGTCALVAAAAVASYPAVRPVERGAPASAPAGRPIERGAPASAPAGRPIERGAPGVVHPERRGFDYPADARCVAASRTFPFLADVPLSDDFCRDVLYVSIMYDKRPATPEARRALRAQCDRLLREARTPAETDAAVGLLRHYEFP